MIRISNLKLHPGHSGQALVEKAARALRVPPGQIKKLEIYKRSIDARKKPELVLLYTVDVQLEPAREAALLKKKLPQVSRAMQPVYRFPEEGSEPMAQRPVIVGLGPAGLFAGYMLAKEGYRPLILERGRDIESRKADVDAFWATGRLDPTSNVQFGEGGAGAFSDGKLNTLVKDKNGRNRKVLEIFVENGAPDRILYESKPHLGTDVLLQVVKRMREQMLDWGAQICFERQVTDLEIRNGRLTGLWITGTGTGAETVMLPVQAVLLAIGHSARDTFEMLLRRQVPMEAKAFAVGLRVQHPQSFINRAQYGTEDVSLLGAAPYKLTAKTGSGRGVYSFCMCPGGYVVNASSEAGRLAINGMSYSGRNGSNANSAVIVSVMPKDYGAQGPLAGVAFQRRLEEAAFRAAGGKVPVETYGDFLGQTGRKEHIPEGFLPAIKGEWAFADVRSILPETLAEAFIEGMEAFDRMIPGFADDAVLLAGIESRTSSPVRIPRDEGLESAVKGLYPCGEGAGYAGGIMSAAMDGLRAAEEIGAKYKRSLEQ